MSLAVENCYPSEFKIVLRICSMSRPPMFINLMAFGNSYASNTGTQDVSCSPDSTTSPLVTPLEIRARQLVLLD